LFNALPPPSLPKGGVPGIPWPVSLRVRDEEDLLEVSERVSSSIEKKEKLKRRKRKIMRTRASCGKDDAFWLLEGRSLSFGRG